MTIRQPGDTPKAMRHPRCFGTVFLFLMLVGCKTQAHLHVWAPPELRSMVGKRVLIAGVEGKHSITKPLVEEMIRQAPNDLGREVQLASWADELHTVTGSDSEMLSTVMQASYASDETTDSIVEPPSDVAMARLATESGYDYVLRGRVLQKQTRAIQTPGSDGSLVEVEPLIVSWQLSDPKGLQAPIGQPLMVELNDVELRYPDLTYGDPQDRMVAAAARDTNKLIMPQTSRVDVTLAVPYGLPGSRDVRRGVDLAKSGRWSEASGVWSEVASSNPLQVSALINLAIAHVAAQEYSEAKKLARQAIRRAPSRLAQETLVWIELRQREFHRAFGLSAPAEGWFVTAPETMQTN